MNAEAALLSLIAELYAASQAQQDHIKQLEAQLMTPATQAPEASSGE